MNLLQEFLQVIMPYLGFARIRTSMPTIFYSSVDMVQNLQDRTKNINHHIELNFKTLNVIQGNRLGTTSVYEHTRVD